MICVYTGKKSDFPFPTQGAWCQDGKWPYHTQPVNDWKLKEHGSRTGVGQTWKKIEYILSSLSCSKYGKIYLVY